jgi:hypothetical protein
MVLGRFENNLHKCNKTIMSRNEIVDELHRQAIVEKNLPRKSVKMFAIEDN